MEFEFWYDKAIRSWCYQRMMGDEQWGPTQYTASRDLALIGIGLDAAAASKR